jgi:hypothetical protein
MLCIMCSVQAWCHGLSCTYAARFGECSRGGHGTVHHGVATWCHSPPDCHPLLFVRLQEQ